MAYTIDDLRAYHGTGQIRSIFLKCNAGLYNHIHLQTEEFSQNGLSDSNTFTRCPLKFAFYSKKLRAVKTSKHSHFV
jgi:hypothetical protein